MKPDEQRMRDVLVDTIRLLCRTGVEYSRRLRVQGLLGITVDDEHVFLIHVDDFIARNCTDVDDSLCGFVDECATDSHGVVSSDVAAARVDGVDRSVSQDIRGNCVQPPQLGPVVPNPKHLLLSRSTQNDILAAVAVSEISSAVAASAEAGDGLLSQLLPQNTHSMPLNGNVLPTAVAETCQESVKFAGRGHAGVTESRAVEPDASVNLPQSSGTNETVTSDNTNEAQVFINMEADGGRDVKTENVVVAAFGDTQTGATMCGTSALGQDGRQPSNLDDVDSSSADEDADSERTSESEEVADQMTAPRLDVSSMQYNAPALMGNLPRWQVGGMQHCGSDGGTETVAIQPAVLTGVVQTGGSHASTYYQQQVVFFVLMQHSGHIVHLFDFYKVEHFCF